MPTFEYDRRYIEWGLEILDDYLLADGLFWPVGVRAPTGEPEYPMFTFEGLLLSVHRLQAHIGRLAEETQVAKLAQAVEMVHTHWQVAWEKKAVRGYISRLKMWRDYLEEYIELPENHANRYVYEVRLRVFLEILQANTGGLDERYLELLGISDGFLKAVLIPGMFIWEREIQEGFPADHYWYLYGNLPSTLRHGFAGWLKFPPGNN
jgi:hypothetical protein